MKIFNKTGSWDTKVNFVDENNTNKADIETLAETLESISSDETLSQWANASLEEAAMCLREQQAELERVKAELAALRRDKELCEAEILNIANATPAKWGDELGDANEQFVQWTQNRARFTLAELVKEGARDE